MGEGCDLVEAEHRARALDGVQGTKRRIDQIAVVGTLAEVEQRRFERLEELARLLSKNLCGIQCGHERTSLPTTASNWSGLNGLVIQAVAPALLASCLVESLDSVVRNTMGSPVRL